MTHSGLNNSEMKNFRDNLSERRIEPREALHTACLPNLMNDKYYRWKASSAYGDAGPQIFTSFRSIGVCRMKKRWPIHRHLQQPIFVNEAQQEASSAYGDTRPDASTSFNSSGIHPSTSAACEEHDERRSCLRCSTRRFDLIPLSMHVRY